MLEMDIWMIMLEPGLAALMYAPRGVEDGTGMLWTKNKLITYLTNKKNTIVTIITCVCCV